jgi:hypothetical protein
MMTGAIMASRRPLDPLSAGAFLLTVLTLCLGAGALLGIVVDAVGVGVAVGGVIGIPASVAAVILRYRGRV